MENPNVTCPHCGSLIGEDANFCPRCGTDLRPGEIGNDEIENESGTTSSAAETPSPQTTDAATADREPKADSRRSTPKPVAQRSPQPSAPRQSDLFSSLSGLLDPVGVSGEFGGEMLTSAAERRAANTVDGDALRAVRYRMLQEPTLGALVQPMPPTHGVYRVRWIFALLGLFVLIPLFAPSSTPTLAKQPWGGATDAYDQVNGLTEDKHVLLVWAYDPATVGEMDGLVTPVLRHLARQKVKLEVVSLLPGGLATAQRLLQPEVTAGKQSQNQPSQTRFFHFVAGGVTALPLIGAVSCGDENCTDNELLDLGTCAPKCNFALAVMVAAQTEDVQRWLEVATPLNNIPVLAVTSTAADLALRPYWQSGQLVGLVGGFDGVSEYLSQNTQLLDDEQWSQHGRSLYQLRWGHFALLIVLFLGNLVALGTVRGEE